MRLAKIAFDIGCNRGDKTKFLLQNGYERIIAVDAHPIACRNAMLRFKDYKDVIFLNKLVSNVSGNQMDFFLCKYSPISTASRKFMEKFGNPKNRKWRKKIQVESITLDELVYKYGIPDFVKIDVEGYEYFALLGLSQKLKTIAFEWHEELFDEAQNCVNHLKSLGYTQFAFVYRDLNNMNLTYDRWENLALHKDIDPKRKKKWGMIFTK